MPGGNSARAGLKPNDKVLKINNRVREHSFMGIITIIISISSIIVSIVSIISITSIIITIVIIGTIIITLTGLKPNEKLLKINSRVSKNSKAMNGNDINNTIAITIIVAGITIIIFVIKTPHRFHEMSTTLWS